METLLMTEVPPAPQAATLAVGDCARTLPRALAEVAELEYRLGAWPAAYTSAVDSVRAAQVAGQHEETMRSLTRLALVEAGLGRADACRGHAGRAIELSRSVGSKADEAIAGEAVGFLELGLGRIDAAIERLEAVELICSEHPNAWLAAVTWAQDLAEAFVRRGDRSGAERAVASLEERATHSGSCALAAALERSRAILASDETFELTFQRALEWAARAQQPFEQARTDLAFGERLRHTGRQAHARELLLRALHAFETLESEPWAGRARQELAAMGAPPQRASVGLAPRRASGSYPRGGGKS